MKVCSVILQAARRPAQEPVPFQEILPLKLKTSVSGKGDRTKEVGCLQEMSILFACFKKNDFNQALCSTEMQTFQSCYKDFLGKKKVKKEQDTKGILTPGSKNLSHKQINQMLKQFP